MDKAKPGDLVRIVKALDVPPAFRERYSALIGKEFRVARMFSFNLVVSDKPVIYTEPGCGGIVLEHGEYEVLPEKTTLRRIANKGRTLHGVGVLMDRGIVRSLVHISRSVKPLSRWERLRYKVQRMTGAVWGYVHRVLYALGGGSCGAEGCDCP